ncbi:unnamed protein product [Ixodes hexagonus]
MKEGDVDYVAFLTDSTGKGRPGLSDVHSVSCSRRQALLLSVTVLVSAFLIALIAAFARPVPRCPSTPRESGGARKAVAGGGNPGYRWNDIRLPSFARPLHYELAMRPNLSEATNRGSVNITLTVLRASDFLVLHAKNLSVTQVRLWAGGASVLRWHEMPDHDQLYVELDSGMAPGNATLGLDFEGPLHRDLIGLYLSSYTTAANETRLLAVTQFEPTSARRAFPCLDEPALKATFELTVWHDAGLRAYANTRPLESRLEGAVRVTRFERTPRMSTYLVALVVCDYTVLEDSLGTLQLQVLVPEEQKSQGGFALDIMKGALQFFDSFFNISCPMNKLDLIAIPDFGPGAMENWGLITFRMSSLLYDDGVTPIKSKERIASTVAHELAHQWFGNLVTMSWWDDLWLNEGFATFLETVCVDHLRPEWGLLDLFPYSTSQPALDLDSLQTSHPVSARVHDPAEIDALFDSISYNKGAAIIAMLESFLGSGQLRRGLSLYLNTYRFSNARTSNLWDAFTNVTSGLVDVAEVMDTWTRQKGYPVVRVALSPSGQLVLSQRRFRLVPSQSDVAAELPPELGYRWFVPLSLRTDVPRTHLFWMNRTDVRVHFAERPPWVKANVNQTGFYRVNYEASNWAALGQQLHTQHEALSASDRAGLLDDAFTLARARELNVSVAMDLSGYLSRERDFAPWATALPHLLELYRLAEDSPWQPLLQKHLLALLGPAVQALGWQDEGSHLERKLRAELLLAALELGDLRVLGEAGRLFTLWAQGRQQIAANLKDVVYRAGVMRGGRREWDLCWGRYLSSQVPSEKALLLQALGATRDLWQLQQYLQLSLDQDRIKAQDVHTVVGVVSANPIGHLVAWHFLKTHWDAIYNLFKETTFSLDNILSELLRRFKTKYDYQEVETFFGQVDLKSGRVALEQALERIRSNIIWKDDLEVQLSTWLEAKPPTAGPA